MTTVSKDAGASATVTSAGSSSSKIVWADLKPKGVVSEDTMSEDAVKAVWAKIYAKVGMSTANESERASLRMGIYAYLCYNGTSRDGDYAGKFKLSNGKMIEASVIPQSAGKDIRKFMRGNMAEAYEALKSSGVMEDDVRYVARAASFGVSPPAAFAMADWFDDCPFFTPLEKTANACARNFGLKRARAARGNQTLERVEGNRINEEVNSSAPMEHQTAPSGDIW